MKIKITQFASIMMIIAACNTSKKNTTSAVAASPTPPPAPAAPSAPVPSSVYMVAKSPDGIYAPGNEELVAIQAQYKEVTLNQLTEGHAIYTQGACIRCHTAQNIYVYDENRWKHIMDDMAQKAALNDAQKDAVYKYVLAIKAVRPASGK